MQTETIKRQKAPFTSHRQAQRWIFLPTPNISADTLKKALHKKANMQ